MIDIVNIPNLPAVYKLTCKINNKIYIGKANNLQKRIISHRNSIRTKRYSYIINAIRKYGFDSFDLEILYLSEKFDIYELLAMETAYIIFYNSIDKYIGYNMCLCANDRSGVPMSDETKEKMRIINLGRRVTPETKEKLRKFNLGKHHSEETKQKIRIGNIGKRHPHTEEYKKAMSENHWNCSGINNPAYDSIRYKFIHIPTSEIFVGTQYEFYKQYNLLKSGVSRIVSGDRKSYRKWKLLNSNILN